MFNILNTEHAVFCSSCTSSRFIHISLLSYLSLKSNQFQQLISVVDLYQILLVQISSDSVKLLLNTSQVIINVFFAIQ